MGFSMPKKKKIAARKAIIGLKLLLNCWLDKETSVNED